LGKSFVLTLSAGWRLLQKAREVLEKVSEIMM